MKRIIHDIRNKRIGFLLPIIACLFFFSACLSPQKQGDIIEIDISQDYPEKELNLKDIADISYVKLDAADDKYLVQGSVVGVTDKTIVIGNWRASEFLFFTLDGKPKSKVSRRGNGPEEYVSITASLYDEENDELFVNDTRQHKLLVYSSTGEYKRTLSLPKGSIVERPYNFDKNSLLFYDLARSAGQIEGDLYEHPFVRISKKDGQVLEYPLIPEDTNIILGIKPEPGAPSPLGGFILGRKTHIINYRDGFLLYNQETDTMFYYQKNQSLTPVFVRTPPIKEMKQITYMNTLFEVGNYEFIQTMTLVKATPGPLKTTYLVRDKRDGSLFTQKIVFDDFKDANITLDPINNVNPTNNVKVGVLQYEVGVLKEALEKGKLSGELKKIVSEMGEEDNDLLILLHFKN
ncbi:hypothetical protein M2137_000331 [Parabacteroides sp. PFB2-10]|uniref:6-bladed beta-propeller n=1 Tax=Parabacteroides sp. PFB2-10 TaxID=1742405 RepID=UPI002473EE23|nr:6-bladed beta-propeller [Parabacteroides sp. PFB2-10]MDH6311581.1 hypothetical protein [Parabacteroides sp. PFB2-10]